MQNRNFTLDITTEWSEDEQVWYAHGAGITRDGDTEMEALMMWAEVLSINTSHAHEQGFSVDRWLSAIRDTNLADTNQGRS